MTGAPADARLRRARAALRDAGLAGSVQAAGSGGEIAALSLPGDAWERLPAEDGRALLDAIRAAGFRYVALDLEA